MRTESEMDIEADLKTKEQVSRMLILEKNFRDAQSKSQKDKYEIELGKVYNWLMHESDYGQCS